MSIRTRLAVSAGVLTLLAASIGIVIATPAGATSVAVTVTSNADGPGTCPSVSTCTLRQAVTDADAGGPNAAADAVITIAPGLGTITLGSLLEYHGGSGGAHSLTLVGNGATITGNDTFTLFVNYTTGELSIDGLTFTHGAGGTGTAVTSVSASLVRVTGSTFSDNTASNAGGAVYITGGAAEFTGVNFTGNSAVNAGGAVRLDGTGVFTGVAFSENTGEQGGAVFAIGGLTIIDSTFTKNTASLLGGAILSGGEMTITGSTFTENSSLDPTGGGGAVVAVSTLSVTDSDFIRNSDGGYAGAILDAGSTLSVSQSRFSDNSALAGGAVVAFGEAVIDESSFTGNTSTTDGAALQVGGSLELTGSTISDNVSEYGPGAMGVGRVATIVNSTITANVGGGKASTLSADFLSIAYSTITELTTTATQVALEERSFNVSGFSIFATVLTGATTGFDGQLCNTTATSSGYDYASDTSCGLTGTGDVQGVTAASAGLGALADNGGPTLTQLPLVTSPLVGAIPFAACTTGPATGVVTDQRGYARPNVAGGSCDIGAVQLTPSATAKVAGRTVRVTVREFTSTVTVTIHSEPLLLGTITVDASGSGQATFDVPCSVEGVNHEIVATASGGQIASTKIELLECDVPVTPAFAG